MNAPEFARRSPRFTLLSLGAGATLASALLLAACGDTEEGDSMNTAGTNGAAGTTGTAAGEEYFKANCAACHGMSGEGAANLGPELQHPVRDYFAYVVANGRTPFEHGAFPSGVMSAYNVPADTLNSMMDYLASFPKPTEGAGLYLDYCAHCHGANGVSPAPISRNINGEGVSAFISNVRSGHSAGQFSNRREYMPAWTAAELTDAELTLMADYISSL